MPVARLFAPVALLAIAAAALPAPASAQQPAQRPAQRPEQRPASAAPVAAAVSAPVSAPVAAGAPAAAEIGLEIVQDGAGSSPTLRDVVVVAYEGRLADGTVFDANERASLPVDGVVPGFSQGLQRMRKGGRYRLTIPAALGYGAAGVGPIPPNADLIFTVALLDFAPAPVAPLPPTMEIVRAGGGAMPAIGDIVLFRYLMRRPNADPVDSGVIARPMRELPQEFAASLSGMKAGGAYRLLFPVQGVETPPTIDIDLVAVATMDDIARLMAASPAPPARPAAAAPAAAPPAAPPARRR